MSFVIVHELQGFFSDGVVSCQGRMRCRCNMRLTMDEATRLADNLADLEGIVGVTVNPATLRLFEERGWIETVGYRESPGRPALLATTRTFLNDLGLRSLAELPGPDAEPLPDFLLSEALPPSAAADEGPMPLQKEIDFEKQQ